MSRKVIVELTIAEAKAFSDAAGNSLICDDKELADTIGGMANVKLARSASEKFDAAMRAATAPVKTSRRAGRWDLFMFNCPSCGAQLELETRGQNAANSRAGAVGWTYNGGRWSCPECSNKAALGDLEGK